MERLRKSLSSLSNFSQDDWEAFSSLWEQVEVGRKINLTSPGQNENYTNKEQGTTFHFTISKDLGQPVQKVRSSIPADSLQVS